MKKAVLIISGMHCASCASNIQRSLSNVKGVKNARVNMIMKKGYVDVDDSIAEEDLKKAVKRAGYEAISVSFE